jgi:hypothetical protein
MSGWSQTDLDAFPPALRQVLDAELAAGNSIVEVGHHHPAAPCGAFVMLASPVTTHPRANTDAIGFYQRNSSSYSGEFADRQRHFFILEPPLPPPEPPDMDAIRAAANIQVVHDREGSPASRHDAGPSNRSPMQRFEASRAIYLSTWREGDGFDLDALRAMTPAQRRTVAASLIPPAGWREVEALAAIGGARVRRALAEAARSGSLRTRLAVAYLSPQLVDRSLHTEMLVQALQTAQIMSGLSEALDQIETFHPPPVLDALFRGLMEREGEVAYHCAELLAVIHGVVPSRHDWSMRPLYLRFNTEDREARREALAELEALIARAGGG